MADTSAPLINKCNTCQLPATVVALNPCGRCNSVFYCSDNCELADSGQHQMVCFNSIQASTASNAFQINQTQPSAPTQTASPPVRPALAARITNPFKRLSLNQWLHDRPEIDVYTLLIDTYRLRVCDDILLRLEINPDFMYGQDGDGGEGGFRRFLQRVESHPGGLLPSWWSPIQAEACVQFGLSDDGWSDLDRTVKKADIVDHYKDWMLPMQLRVFGQSIYTGANAMKGNYFKELLELEHRESDSG
ncbi:hypothetical protein F1880_008655 [Penicillium rolfsii]|nr:hypothetical protein F1880_008655 [Penicillium rolfsii]